jgi:ABC-type transport system involved in cytochrome bd biosynthesis fused ATPase/permease subunit
VVRFVERASCPIFDSTIRDDDDDDDDDDDLRNVSWWVRLLQAADRLPDGLDTHLGEGGHRLCEGERRRTSVAPALSADCVVECRGLYARSWNSEHSHRAV